MNDSSMKTFKHDLIKRPHAICLGLNDELFITEYSGDDKILIFDKEMKFKREFNIVKDLEVENIFIDLKSKDKRLYITDKDNNQITVWKSENGDYITTIKIDSPGHIEFNENSVFVTSITDVDGNEETRKLNKIESGSNCIFELNKSNYEIINKIAFDNWIQPWGLCLDENSNIITTAFQLNENQIISEERYLYIIDRNKSILSKIDLGDWREVAYDMKYFDNKIVICFAKHLRIIELN